MIWVAEIGSMHKGVPSLAFELIRQAKESGATIAKFQFGWTKEAQDAQGHIYNSIRYVDPFADDLKKWCDYFDIELMASIWSMEGLETARRVGMKRYKIAHQLNRDVKLRTEIYRDEKDVFHSGYPNALYSIWVNENYPAYPGGLGMPREFGGIKDWFGYSDHTHGIEACLLAVARGAKYIEKHFCLDKTDLVVRDTPFSATPQEFAEMVRLGNEIERLLNAQV